MDQTNRMKNVLRLLVMMMLFGGLATTALAAPQGSFEAFLKGFEQKAVSAGIDRTLYRTLTAGMTPDPRMPNLIASQPEFTTPVWDYLQTRVSSGRVQRGQAAVKKHRAVLNDIGTRFGVDPYVLAAIWGIETDFGAVLGNDKLIRPVIRSLASVAYQKRGRVAEDEAELIAALKLVQDHHWSAQSLVGSWAGAIGHTQIIVSGVLAHGSDGDGDGVVNPHRSLADALATTARYLKALGYVSGADWGYEVAVPKGFDYLLATRETLRPVRDFAALGVTRVAGRTFGNLDEKVFLYVPAGETGPKFLMTANYLVFKGYNFSDSYAMAVAHLTDRLKGSGNFDSAWPKDTRFPNIAQRISIQENLKKLGFYQGEVDGRIGPISQQAYQYFQHKNGLTADGFITYRAYEELQKAAR